MMMLLIGTLAEKLVRKVAVQIHMNRIKGSGQDSRAFRDSPIIFDIPETSLEADKTNPPPK